MSDEIPNSSASDPLPQLKDEGSQELLTKAREAWYNNFSAELAERRKDRREELQRLNRQDTVVFWMFIVATSLGLLLVPGGLFLVVIGKTVFGTISSFAGLLAGASVIPLKMTSSRIDKQKQEVERRENEDGRASRYLSMAIMTDDPHQRALMMGEFAKLQLLLMQGGNSLNGNSSSTNKKSLPQEGELSEKAEA
ncbi:hypothetical protein [Nonomuraea sp. NPDC003709]|uniref:TRADD-N-associated membrane domain-containing protein n=1 Tax=Nonomuraea sp. NPDC003709 TaxID=3154450 RepID=UPI0033A0C65E